MDDLSKKSGGTTSDESEPPLMVVSSTTDGFEHPSLGPYLRKVTPDTLTSDAIGANDPVGCSGP